MRISQRLMHYAERMGLYLGYIAGALILVMMLTVVYDVFARRIFNAPTLWMIDLNEYLLPYVTFIPAAWILLRDGHVSVSLVVDRMQPEPRRKMRIFTDILGLAYSAILVWQGWLMAYESLRAGYRFATVYMWPRFPVYVIIPIGGALLCLAFLIRLLVAVGQKASPQGSPEEAGS
jgi:TRAP-type C4-dicarboxylate transport system permease small subunit